MEICVFFWTLAALFPALAALFHWKKKQSSQIPINKPTTSTSSSTSNSNSSSRTEYEVFLSFRGPEVRTNFADFLYSHLDRSRIRTFLDEEGLHKGEEIAPSLLKAIEESKVYIPILSRNYASSKWCLRELAKMVECCKQGNGHVLLPIFYMVDPRDVRHPDEGCYGGAFREHCKNHDAGTVGDWRDALGEVGKMKGWHVTEIDRQGAIIDQVFSKVWSELRMKYMLHTDHLIGIDSRIRKMKMLLQLDYEGVKAIGIHGMGGIGKTTIAKAIYNEVRGKFDHYCFVEDVRETLSSKTNGIVSLQRKVICSILRSDCKVKDANEGINIIKDSVHKRKVLIVLDDVDNTFEFDRIFGRLEDFNYSGSRFIITTRDRRVMDLFQPYELYEPEEMNEDDSLRLFSRHAFGVDHPPTEEDVRLSMKFVKAASCLPLSLKVIGSLLFRRDETFWGEALKKLKNVLPSEVQERLRISYNTLRYEEQQIFLDIACFLVGQDKAKSFHMWNSCGYHPEVGIATLIERSFVKINQTDEKEEFWMHDHMIDLGRKIVREEDIECPWKRSRIWSNRDAMDMLAHEKGTGRVKALRVETRDKSFKLTVRQFEKLTELRYLEVVYGNFEGDFKNILPDIRWLEMRGCNSNLIDCDMKKLVILSLNHCSVTKDWRGWENIKAANNLKAICLRRCNSIRFWVPDLSECRNLESIDIRVCEGMRGELDVGNLRYLKMLTISNSPITKLLGDFGKLRNLQEITVRGGHLRSFPDGITRLSSSLVHLSIQTHGMTNKKPVTLPTSLKRVQLDSTTCVPNLAGLKNLEELEFYGYMCRFPKDMRKKLSKLKSLMLTYFGCAGLLDDDADCGLPSSLVSLEIKSSMSLVKLPDLGNLSSLRVLFLWKTSVREIPGLGKLRMLRTLKIVEAPGLMNLDGVEHQTLLTTLIVEGCDLLEKLPDMSCFKHLQSLTILGCKKLAGVSGIENLEGLTTLRIDKRLDIPPLRRTVKIFSK